MSARDRAVIIDDVAKRTAGDRVFVIHIGERPGADRAVVGYGAIAFDSNSCLTYTPNSAYFAASMHMNPL